MIPSPLSVLAIWDFDFIHFTTNGFRLRSRKHLLRVVRQKNMISEHLFEKIREKNGCFASWAVWEPQSTKPKSNMGPKTIFDLRKNPTLLQTLHTNVVMIALNFSRELVAPEPFSNFHDESPYANDFKIRYAFTSTPFYGAYMTDALKNLVIPDAQKVRDYIKKYPEKPKEHIKALEIELDFIESKNPQILAFGRDTYEILKKYLSKNRYSQLIKITHYSHQVRKEKYKADVLEQIEYQTAEQ